MFSPGPRTRTMPVRSRAEHGFTLPELLLALLLFSLVLLMLYGGLFHAGNHLRMSEVQLRKNDDKRFILSVVRRQVEQALPLIQAQGGETRILFRGGNNSLEFVSALPSYDADDGLYFLKLEIQEGEMVLKFLPLTRRRNLFAEDIFADAEQVHLAQHVDQVSFEYFGRHGLGTEPAWRDAWNNEFWLPLLVRIRFETNDHHPWPPLVVRYDHGPGGDRPNWPSTWKTRSECRSRLPGARARRLSPGKPG